MNRKEITLLPLVLMSPIGHGLYLLIGICSTSLLRLLQLISESIFFALTSLMSPELESINIKLSTNGPPLVNCSINTKVVKIF